MPDFTARRIVPARASDSPAGCLTLGPNVSIVGLVEYDGAVEIDGFVQGEVRCASVTISKYGTVSGKVIANSVTVSGGVSGSIFAERLVLKSTCDVEGEICYRDLALEDGSYFEGSSRPHHDPLEQAAGTRPQPYEPSTETVRLEAS